MHRADYRRAVKGAGSIAMHWRRTAEIRILPAMRSLCAHSNPGRGAAGVSLLSLWDELLILCARIGYNP